MLSVGHTRGLRQVCQVGQVVMRNMGEKYAICFYKEKWKGKARQERCSSVSTTARTWFRMDFHLLVFLYLKRSSLKLKLLPWWGPLQGVLQEFSDDGWGVCLCFLSARAPVKDILTYTQSLRLLGPAQASQGVCQLLMLLSSCCPTPHGHGHHKTRIIPDSVLDLALFYFGL